MWHVPLLACVCSHRCTIGERVRTFSWDVGEHDSAQELVHIVPCVDVCSPSFSIPGQVGVWCQVPLLLVMLRESLPVAAAASNPCLLHSPMAKDCWALSVLEGQGSKGPGVGLCLPMTPYNPKQPLLS